MKSRRSTRVAEQIKEEVAAILRGELKDPRIGFVSVTGAEVSSDLRYAKVFVSVMGSEEERRSSLEALRQATGFVRREIGQRLSLFHTPEITFRLDSSIAQGARIEQLLREVGPANEGDA